jgi:hypothetical protein
VPTRGDRLDAVFDYLKKSFVYQYLGFSRKRKTLFSTLKLYFSLQPEAANIDTITPFYLLGFLSCSELNLKKHLLEPKNDSSNQYVKQYEKREYQAANQLKILNLDEFEEIMIDFDRYVKEPKRRLASTVHLFMKNNRLSSLVHSKPAEETVFRYMDIRIRVYLYSAMRKSMASFSLADQFYKFMNKAGFKENKDINFDSSLVNMQVSVSKTQRCMLLSVHDLLLKHQWTEEGLLDEGQIKNLRGWLNLIERKPKQQSLMKVYNTALFNRLLNLKFVLSDFLKYNNPVLRELVDLSGISPPEQAEQVIEATGVHLDTRLKTIIAKKTAKLMERWTDEFTPAELGGEQNQNNSRLLFSLKLTIKLCQIIQVVQNYFKSKNALVEPSSSEGLSPEVHLLAPLDFSSTSETLDKDKGYLRYLMSKLLLSHILKDSKCREMQEVLQKFRETVKKDQDTIFKNAEFDHLVAQNINFCQMAVLLSGQQKPLSKKKEAPELAIDQVTVDNYLAQTIDSSFLFPNRSLLESNLAGIFVELAKNAMDAQVAVYQRASLEIAIRKPKRKQPQEPKRKDNLASNLMGNNETQILPFLVNFLARFIGKSYSIVTNNEEDCYIIGREDFLDLMVVLLRESGAYTQKITSTFRDHYLVNYIHALYARVVSASSLKFLKRHFLLLLRDFHKLIEGQLAEKNFSVVYELDRLTKFARYAVYDGGMILDKLKEEVAIRYTPQMNEVELEAQNIAVRAASFKSNHLPLKILEFGAQLHNSNMASLEEKASKVLEDKVTVVDVKTRQQLEPGQIQGSTGEAQIGKVHSAIERLKQMFREKVMLELNKFETENKRLEEQINKEDNTRKKIRELTVRESLLKEELAATKSEMDALTQQNSVLERDIHTCNFERINLTRQLQEAKEKLDKIQIEINRQIADRARKPRKSLFPVIAKESQVTQSAVQKQGHKHLTKVKSQQGFAGLHPGTLEEFPEESEINPSKEEVYGRESVGQTSSNSKPKKKGFAFVNGRLERRFNVKK